jgi:hypothetical protein
MNANRADDLLARLRELPLTPGEFRRAFDALDAHLSAGGNPPEAWREGPDAPASYPEGTHRDDMSPRDALIECYDLWASGAWDDRNAVYDLAEVMGLINHLVSSQEAQR